MRKAYWENKAVKQANVKFDRDDLREIGYTDEEIDAMEPGGDE
jgi:hypothetical protein